MSRHPSWLLLPNAVVARTQRLSLSCRVDFLAARSGAAFASSGSIQEDAQMLTRARVMLIVAGLATSVAHAQTDIAWTNASGGGWSNAANWAGANVPDTSSERPVIAIAGTYDVEVDNTFSVGGLVISNASASV